MSQLYADVQRALAPKNFDPGSINGLWGPKTRVAMQGIEISMHLPVTAELTDAVLANLLGKSTPAPIGWLDEATPLMGLKEGPGAKDNPTILEWADDLDVHYPHDSMPGAGCSSRTASARRCPMSRCRPIS
jgi:hypothetical protein